jgi:hypothetical protein
MRVAFLVVMALLLGMFSSFLIVELQAPDMPLWIRFCIGLFMSVGLAVFFIKNHRDQVSAFESVRLGDRARCAALLQKRRSDGTMALIDAFGTAALAVAVGDSATAMARLRGDTIRIGVSGQLRTVVEAHAALISADLGQHAPALASLLDVGRLPHVDAERYRAYLVARATLSPVGGSLLARADHALAAYQDPEARAYLQWMRAQHEVTPFDAHDRSQDMHRAAELAALQGLPALAAKVSARAAALERAAAQIGPYRR